MASKPPPINVYVNGQLVVGCTLTIDGRPVKGGLVAVSIPETETPKRAKAETQIDHRS